MLYNIHLYFINDPDFISAIGSARGKSENTYTDAKLKTNMDEWRTTIISKSQVILKASKRPVSLLKFGTYLQLVMEGFSSPPSAEVSKIKESSPLNFNSTNHLKLWISNIQKKYRETYTVQWCIKWFEEREKHAGFGHNLVTILEALSYYRTNTMVCFLWCDYKP